MTRIIAFAQRKGGTGKTTLAVSIAGELSYRGCKVDLIDADPQKSAWAWAVPRNLPFPVWQIELRPGSIGEWVQNVKTIESEFMVIDTAPNEQALEAAIALAHLVVIPCSPSGLDIDVTRQALSIIAAARERRATPIDVILVPNRVDARTLEGQQLVEELEQFGKTVGSPVGSRSAFVRAFSSGHTVAECAPGSAADLEIKSLCDVLQETMFPE
ncbi:MAG: ParA family protein [Methylacidiphilales bacterium]|nr:ParA family protein [Candidatus Methylacidiphilales bacterium]